MIFGLESGDATAPYEYVPPVPAVEYNPGVVGDKDTPVQWLQKNSYSQPSWSLSAERIEAMAADKPKAAFIALVRNSEEAGMVHSILQVEARFNSRKMHRYDWIFFNDESFSDSFKSAVSSATSSQVYFEQIKEEHWSIPEWIDESRFDVGREFQGGIGVGKAWLKSYHKMCRWNSGLFALEDRLKNYDWYWRVEPDVHYTCDINYDVFRFMRDNQMAYGFNMAILDDARSFPSLWERTQTFKKKNKDLVHPEADMSWLIHENEESDRRVRSGFGYHATAGDQYNNCQFYSNFEIGSLDFFRGEQHQAYFNHLDRAGGFFYERFGDAPIHTLSVSMFLPKRQIWYFRDIGYSHGLCENCPPHVAKLPMGPDTGAADVSAANLHKEHHHFYLVSKDFERQNKIPGLMCGCTSTRFDSGFSRLVPYESKQVKPNDTCIRLWLRGNFLLKKTGWNLTDVIESGGDEYGGYLITGLEPNPPEV
ncbi:glycosyltransferase family 15 protein [Pestalotiopsis sp. NC0098]|nr:glycosyltransferase family 15 protein [Pestalotiopsis sp. NC0098]